VYDWCSHRFKPIDDLEGPDVADSQTEIMTQILNDAINILTSQHEAKRCFSNIGVAYYKIIALELDKQVSQCISRVMLLFSK
jgi:hypothetical protein